ncbi:hypothetical protein BH20ACI1_BH20ACI1_25050 [soil metagenome]
MNVHRIEAVVGSSKTIILKDLPFNEGEEIEIIVLEKNDGGKSEILPTLQGTLLKYDEPFKPVTEED